MIYFLQPVDGGPVKIGTSENVEARHRQLEAHYGVPLALLATMPGGRAEEAEVHAQFDHLRLGRTEQFRPAPELMAYIGRPLLVGANPAIVEALKPALESVSNVMSIRGTAAWKEWLDRYAARRRVPSTALIDQVLAEAAERDGFEPPPPRY